MGVAEVDDEKYHQRGESVVAETVVPGRVKVGGAVAGAPWATHAVMTAMLR